MAEMTKEVIVASCKANGGYAAPRLNDQLFLHCKGFTAIKNLEPYREAKVLWLEQNALSDLSGLEQQGSSLVSLFLQNNFIRSLTSLTATLTGLRVLNVSHNYLTSLRGLAAACPSLETLQASHNQLTSLEVCEELWQLADTLTSVDLSFNRIETSRAPKESAAATPATPASPATPAPMITAAAAVDDDDICVIDPADGSRLTDAISPFHTNVVAKAATAAAVMPAVPKGGEDALALVRFFQRLPLVSVIYMQGNGLSHRLRSYRRNMILHLSALTYLDERPVFPEERRVVEAWGRGGEDAEAAERAAIREEKRAHLTQCVKVLTEQRDGQREMRDRLTQQLERRRAQELEELTQRRRKDRDDRAAVEAAEQVAREAEERAEQDAWWDVEDLFRTAHAGLAAHEAAHRHAYEQHIAVVDATEEAAAHSQADVSEVNAVAAVKVLEDAGTAASCAAVFSSRRGSGGSDTTSTAAIVANTAATPSSALAELLQSDDEILREMESEIDHVLYDIGAAAAAKTSAPAVSQSHVDPSTLTTGDAASSSAPLYSRQQVTDRTTLRQERNVHSAVGHVATQLRAQPGRRGSAAQRESVWQRFEQWEARRASLPTNSQ